MPDKLRSDLNITEGSFRELAVYSDETKQFRFPLEPLFSDEVKVSIRVGKDTFSAVFLCTDEREYLMEKAKEDDIFEYYQTILPPTKKKVTYYFRLQHGEEDGFYNKYGYFTNFASCSGFE